MRWSGKKKHFKSISNNYKKSKYYSKYIVFFEELYSKKWERIEDLNIYILKYLIKEFEYKNKNFF